MRMQILPSLLTAAFVAFSLPLAAQTQPGEVLSQQKIAAVAGSSPAGAFGGSVAALGDVDGDGVVDLIAGAFWDDTGGFDRGVAYVLRMNADGTVKASSKIGSGVGGVALDDYDYFGSAVAGIGDLDGDGVVDAAVAASGDDDGLSGASSNSVGALWILFLDAAGGVKGSQKLSATQGGLVGPVEQYDNWFSSVAGLGDFDGDGVRDIAVGVQQDDDGGNARGAVYLLFLNANGTVKAEKKISATQGAFGGTLHDADLFGSAVATFDDLDGNGVVDLAVGAAGDDDGVVGSFVSRGAVWILFLDANGDVSSETKISSLAGGFTGALNDNEGFGTYAAVIGDVDGDGVDDLAVGAHGDDGSMPSGSFSDFGAVWILFLHADGTVKDQVEISELGGGLAGGTLDPGDSFGRVAALGDLDGDGAVDLAVGASGDDDAGGNHGAVYVLFLHDELHGAPLGCGVNPPGSVLELSGRPALGETWTIGVENPLGTQPAGSVALLAIAFAPDPATPCGTVLGGLGMASAAAPGEILVSVLPPLIVAGPVVWGGLGSPAPFPLPVPTDPMLIGTAVFVQGAIVDAGVGVGLSTGLAAVLQP